MKKLLLLFYSVTLFATPLSHKVALKAVEFARPAKNIPFTGYYRLQKQSALFFNDLGAKRIHKDTGLSGYYLSFEDIKMKSGKTFGKWKEILKEPKNTKLLELFEANLATSNINELFSFPREVRYLNGAKNATVLIFLDYTIPLSMQVRDILNFSLRGYNVLAVDFYCYNEGNYPISWDECKSVADKAYNVLKGEIIVYGKSFGSAAATYLGVKHKLSHVILDRPFSSMDEVANSHLLSSFINTYYSYPTKDLIGRLTSPPLIISSSDSTTFSGHAEALLSTYLSYQKNAARDNLAQKCFISTRGGHYSSLLNKGASSWFSYEEAQRKLNNYLSK